MQARLTCARCLRYAVQWPDLAQLERHSHLMTAVRVRTDCAGRQYEHRHDPKGSAGLYAWEYSSGHCCISRQVPSACGAIDYCRLAPKWVTVSVVDGVEGSNI